MTDRELLELAAKAAGYQYRTQNQAIVVDGIPANWNPLNNDGDALQLAVKLGILGAPAYVLDFITANGEDDPYAATRRAIVRAAAEIGWGMK